jgi:hypothetical protein
MSGAVEDPENSTVGTAAAVVTMKREWGIKGEVSAEGSFSFHAWKHSVLKQPGVDISV